MLNNCTRRVFRMNGGQIGPTVAKVVALIIKTNNDFARYDLSQNKIGDLGIEAIAAVFKQKMTPSIIELNVSTNSL